MKTDVKGKKRKEGTDEYIILHCDLIHKLHNVYDFS